MFELIHPVENPKLKRFALQLQTIETGYSGLLTAYLAQFPDFVFEGDTLSLYMDGQPVFTGNVVFIDDLILKASGDFALGVGTIDNTNIVFYNNTKLRLAIDFDIVPGVDLETGTHSVTVSEVNHYSSDSYYSEISL